MRKLNSLFRAQVKANKVPEHIANRVVAEQGDNRHDNLLYTTSGPGITEDWFSETKLLGKLQPTPVDLAELYFCKIGTWYGLKPFEFWLNPQHFNDICAPYLGRFATMLDTLDNEAERVPFLKPLMIDTGNFIATGKRQIPLRLLTASFIDWRNQCDKEGTHSLGQDAPIVKRMWRDDTFNGMPSNTFFLKWVQQKGGIADFIAAHRLLFGV